MKSKEHQILEQQIEELVRSYLEGCRQAAATAVERAFAAATSGPRRRVERQVGTTPRRRRPPRSPEELARLEEQVYAALCETPGVTMGVLAARFGVEARSLEAPIKRLRRQERVRSVGRRGFARYFPMVGEPASKTKLVAVGKGA